MNPSDDDCTYIEETSTAIYGSTEGSSTPLIFQFIVDKGFDIKEKIGSGHFADVYRATWTQMPNTDIACKRIVIEEVDKEWRDNCLKQEMLIMKRLSHSHIVKVYEVIKTRSVVFIFMELAENGTIKDHLKKAKHPYKESQAKIWFKQIMDGLSYMHSIGIAHRDMKLENFLLNSEWEALISDFSFACIDYESKDKLLRETRCGTPAYMAPEVHNARQDEPYDAKSADLYSMGVCLFEMINYDKPFNEDLATNSLSKLIQLKLRRIYRYHKKLEPILSDHIKDLVHQLLEPEPEKRITTELILSHSALQ